MPADHPFDLSFYQERDGHVEYHKGQCPVADDLFNRSIRITLNQWYSERDCDNIAAGINKVLSAYCTQDTRAKAWL
jgi:hypothetical protein